MIIDTTTHNTIYNPASAQGQWFNHRWGQRNYPLVELSEASVQVIINAFPNEIISLESTYGDPACFGHLKTLCKAFGNNLSLRSYGMFSQDQLDCLAESKSQVTIEIDGWGDSFGKVYLGASFEKLKNSLSCLPNCNVIYYTYEHNECDIPSFIDYISGTGINVSFIPGPVHDGVCQAIISKQCEWLYDVLPSHINSNGFLNASSLDAFKNTHFAPRTILVKHIYTYNTLRTFVNKAHGKSIINKPVVPKYFPDQSTKELFDTAGYSTHQKMISPTGHYFDSSDLGFMFNMFLADDWKFTVRESNNYDTFMLRLLYDAQHLVANTPPLLTDLYKP